MSEDTQGKVKIVEPSAQADWQDPLPESKWLWRRIFFFSLTTFFCYLLWDWGDRIQAVAVLYPESGIPAMGRLMMGYIITINVMAMFYTVAPSAEQITKMIQTARALREGVVFQSAARVQSDTASAETTTTAGQPTAGAAPPELEPQPQPAKKPAGTEILE